MKKSLVITAIAASLFLSSCGKEVYVKPSPTEVDTYMAQNPTLPDFDKACLLNGNFKVGMQAETVRFMLGEPKEIKTVKQAWATQEEWLYKKGGKKVFIIEDGGVVGIEELD